MSDWSGIERVLFIGGNGHFYAGHRLPPAGAAARPRVAVASVPADEPAARKLRERFAADEWFDDPEEALDRFQPQLACVGAPPAWNGRLALTALRRGVPVITDKPAAATRVDLEALAQLHAQGCPALVSELPWRTWPEFRAAQAAIAGGAVGEVALVSAQKSYRFGQRPAWYGVRADYGGTIPWIASHAIDAVTFLTGQRFTRVWAHHANVGRPDYTDLETHAAMFGTLDRGATAAATADLLNPPGSKAHADEWVRVAGTRGVLLVSEKRALLTDAEGAQRPLDLPGPIETGSAMMAAAMGRDTPYGYGTRHSLELAATLIAFRDAADTGQPIDL